MSRRLTNAGNPTSGSTQKNWLAFSPTKHDFLCTRQLSTARSNKQHDVISRQLVATFVSELRWTTVEVDGKAPRRQRSTLRKSRRRDAKLCSTVHQIFVNVSQYWKCCARSMSRVPTDENEASEMLACLSRLQRSAIRGKNSALSPYFWWQDMDLSFHSHQWATNLGAGTPPPLSLSLTHTHAYIHTDSVAQTATYIPHNRKTYMSSAGFEPEIPETSGCKRTP